MQRFARNLSVGASNVIKQSYKGEVSRLPEKVHPNHIIHVRPLNVNAGSNNSEQKTILSRQSGNYLRQDPGWLHPSWVPPPGWPVRCLQRCGSPGPCPLPRHSQEENHHDPGGGGDRRVSLVFVSHLNVKFLFHFQRDPGPSLIDCEECC